jgi:hypothetical protein
LVNLRVKKQQKNEAGFLKDMRSAIEIMHFTRRARREEFAF